MNGLTLKHFRYFCALAEHRHFGRAADTCAVTQPALSLQIKDLEALLGVALVERTKKEIKLTAFGAAFQSHALKILRQVDELSELTRHHQAPFSGPFRLGVIPTIAPYLLPQIITTLGDRFPNLIVAPRETITGSLIALLKEGVLDAAIVALPISEPDLREFALFDEDFVLVRPQSERRQPVPNADALSRMNLLLLEEGHCFRDQALSFCKRGQAVPRTLMEGSSLTTLVQMVAAQMGVTLIPEIAVPIEASRADIHVTRFQAPQPQRTIGMVWRKTTPMSAELMQIGAAVRRVGTELRDAARL